MKCKDNVAATYLGISLHRMFLRVMSEMHGRFAVLCDIAGNQAISIHISKTGLNVYEAQDVKLIRATSP